MQDIRFNVEFCDELKKLPALFEHYQELEEKSGYSGIYRFLFTR